MDPDTLQKINDLSDRFDQLQSFLMEHAVTKQDLQQAIEGLPTKNDFSNLASHIDGYAKNVNDVGKEIVILGEKANRLEAWAKLVAGKLGIEYSS